MECKLALKDYLIKDQNFSSIIAPRGLRELREMGVAPKAEWYDGVSSIYISHMHLDHLGLLSNIPAKMRVHLPSWIHK